MHEVEIMNMKHTKYIFSVALMALSFASCQKDDMPIVVNGNEGSIRYAVSMGDASQTRGSVMNEVSTLVLSDKDGIMTIPMKCVVTEGISADACISEYSTDTRGTLVNTTDNDNKALTEFISTVSSFVAKAYNGNTEIASQTVTWSTGKWVATPETKWPKSTELTFFAYANMPGSQTAEIASTGVSMEHTVSASASDQKDILFGYYKGNGGNRGTAEIRFQHPLTAVIFKVGDIGDEVITSISLSGLAASGTVTMGANGSIGDWNVDAYTATSSQSDDEGLDVDETTKIIGEPFILIPQDLAANEVMLTVVCQSGLILETVITSDEWEKGKTNTYTIGYTAPDPSSIDR